MNAQTQGCDHRRIDDFLDSGHVGLEDEQLMFHLNSCDGCRAYLERQAADPDSWDNAAELLQPGAFDQASSAEFSVATTSHQNIDRPIAVQSVLDSLSASDDPDRLGRLGTYEVSGVVGAGGMGVVLKAIDPSLDRVVAIKVLAPHLANSGTARKRFSREAKAAAAVLHPNVIPIHCVSGDDAIPYLVMAYIRGGSLQIRLQREGPLATVEILRIGSQVAAGLAAAHEQGLVHRDIKPENILLEDGVERVTLTDFGLARAVDDASVTRDGTIAGTPQYMSPEQARGESIDQTSDLFGLGSVLYALCTGRPPFRAETSYGVMRRIIDETPVPIREINPEIPDWLAQIVDKLMAKDKAERYSSAGEVHKLLDACLNHVQQPTHTELPASLCKPPAPTQPQRGLIPFLTSRRGIVTVIGLLAATVLIGVIPLASGDANEDARKAFAQAQSQLHPQTSTGDPTNAVGALLTNKHGREYLVELDKQFKHFTYDDRLALDGESAGAVFIWNRNDAHPNPQMLIRSFSWSGKTKGLTVGLPTQIHATVLKIEKSKLLIRYTASDREADRRSIETAFKIHPGASYETTVEITSLLEGDADWIEPFKNGRLVESSNRLSSRSPTENEDPADRIQRLKEQTPATVNPHTSPGVADAQKKVGIRRLKRIPTNGKTDFEDVRRQLLARSRAGGGQAPAENILLYNARMRLTDDAKTVFVDSGVIQQMWDVTTGRLKEFSAWGESGGRMGFVPDSSLVYFANSSIRLWDSATHAQQGKVIPHTNGPAEAWDKHYRPAVHPSGKLIATRSADNKLRLWHVESQQPASEEFTHEDSVTQLGFSSDGRWLFSKCRNKWTVRSVADPTDAAGPFSDNVSLDAIYSPETQRLATFSNDGEHACEIVVYSLGDKDVKTVRRLTLDADVERHCAWIDGDHLLVSGFQKRQHPNSTLFLISMKAEDPIVRQETLHRDRSVSQIAVAADRRHYVVSTYRSTTCWKLGQKEHVWQVGTSEAGRRHHLHIGDGDWVVLHEKGQTTGARPAIVRALKNGNELWRKNDVIAATANGAAFGVVDAKGIEVWTTNDAVTQAKHGFQPTSVPGLRRLELPSPVVDVSPDEKLALLVDDFGIDNVPVGAPRIWSLQTSKQVSTLPALEGFYLRFVAGERPLCIAGDHRRQQIRFWDIKKGAWYGDWIDHDLRAGNKPIFWPIFSPDGETVSIASLTGEMQFWSLRGDKPLEIQPPAHKPLPKSDAPNPLYERQFSSDGKYCFAVFQGQLYVLNPATATTVAGPFPHRTARDLGISWPSVLYNSTSETLVTIESSDEIKPATLRFRSPKKNWEPVHSVKVTGKVGSVGFLGAHHLLSGGLGMRKTKSGGHTAQNISTIIPIQPGSSSGQILERDGYTYAFAPGGNKWVAMSTSSVYSGRLGQKELVWKQPLPQVFRNDFYVDYRLSIENPNWVVSHRTKNERVAVAAYSLEDGRLLLDRSGLQHVVHVKSTIAAGNEVFRYTPQLSPAAEGRDN